jgi:hypothetical protein
VFFWVWSTVTCEPISDGSAQRAPSPAAEIADRQERLVAVTRDVEAQIGAQIATVTDIAVAAAHDAAGVQPALGKAAVRLDGQLGADVPFDVQAGLVGLKHLLVDRGGEVGRGAGLGEADRRTIGVLLHVA